jgi:hypothetical protein
VTEVQDKKKVCERGSSVGRGSRERSVCV